MKRWLKRTLIGAGLALGGLAAAVGGYVYVQTSAYDASLSKVYDIPLPNIERSTDPAVIARGKHLAESLGGCSTRDCHGSDLGGGQVLAMGPIGELTGPNISSGGLGAVYSDAEFARLLRHGVKKDGRSLRFMPAHEINWMPDSDLVAIISYLRTQPAVKRPNGPVRIGVLGKILDRTDQFVLDVARRINHDKIEIAPKPAPTAEYGQFVARLCTGCHGTGMSGGPLPGAPPSVPIPSNITPHETGIKGWTYADFERLLMEGVRKNGQKLDPFMPVEAFGKLNDIEKKALWAYLKKLPPAEFGGR